MSDNFEERQTTLEALTESAAGRPVIGTILVNPGEEWVELCGNAGLDFVCVDQMVTPVDWDESTRMLRAARAWGTSGWLRLSAYPWGGRRQAEVLQRDVHRAISIGADAITASVDSAEDVEALLEVQHEEHRQIWARGTSEGRYPATNRPTIFPLIESLNGLKALPEIAALDGCEAVFLGFGDISRLLGVTNDIFSDDLTRVVRDAVDACVDQQVKVMSTAGYFRTPEQVLNAVGHLSNLGVEVIWIPYPTFISFEFYSEVMRSIHSG